LVAFAGGETLRTTVGRRVTPPCVVAVGVGLEVTGEAGAAVVLVGLGVSAAAGLAGETSGPVLVGCPAPCVAAGDGCAVAAVVGAVVGAERVETAVWVASKPGVS